jgi:hypothetical protein
VLRGRRKLLMLSTRQPAISYALPWIGMTPRKNGPQETVRYCEPFPAGAFTITKCFSERYRLWIDQRHLHQFYVNRQAQAPVELIKQCGFSAGKHLAKRRYVFHSQVHN